MRPDAERAFRPAIIVPQRTRVALRNLRRLADRRRRCVNAVGLGPGGDVGVHQGGAAQTAAAYYHDRSVNVHLVKPQRSQRRVISLLGHMLDRVREATDRPFLPSLKHADLQFRIEGRVRQASCRDSPAITRAHYDNVIGAGKTLVPSSRKDGFHKCYPSGNRRKETKNYEGGRKTEFNKVRRKKEKLRSRRTKGPFGFDRLRVGGFRTLFVHEWNVIGRDDSRDVADHDACNALNRLLSLVVYPRKDRRARRRRVVIRSVVAGKRAGVAVPTLAARNSQTKGSVA